ncbi:MAG: photosynthetic complex putative assembly protein PuhB, partial [Pseudomonadota bacterium]
VQARATVYTVTNRRIVMRIGAALTLALNLPYRWIGKADLRLRRQGTGTITFDLLGETRFSYLVCWPHVRPWHVQKTQPAFRCIRDAEHVAGLIAEHARTEIAASDARAEPSAIPAE